VVLITGGSRGLGLALAEAFARRGADIVICARNGAQLDLARRRIERISSGTRVLAQVCDVTDRAQVEGLIAATTERFGRLDVLVNNAGGSPPAPAATASPRFSEKIVALNLMAPLHFAQQANAVMQEQPEGGAIVNVASVSALRPSPGTAAYGAAKAGLLSLTRTLAVEWAPKVRVNAVAAGMIRTEQVALHYGDADAQARVAATVPLGRLGTPRDVGEACVFLASPLAAYASGAVLVLDGGGERPAFLAAARGA
jgi:NAD(P)-dependent dehydrogenase (short-subunit alcohol dehydrogenase family)